MKTSENVNVTCPIIEEFRASHAARVMETLEEEARLRAAIEATRRELTRERWKRGVREACEESCCAHVTA